MAETRSKPRNPSRSGAAVREAESIVKTNASHLTASITDEGVKRVWKLVKDHNIKVVDLKFNDLPGLWQHFSIPVEELSESAKEGIWVDGIGFDGSSISGFPKIQESDMNLFPDLSTAVLDPVCEHPTLHLTCDIYDPLTHKP